MVAASEGLQFQGRHRAEVYGWVEQVLVGQQTTRRLALGRVLLPHQDLLHPAINLGPMPALKLKTFAGCNKPADLLQAQLLCLIHADVQSPACLTPSGSSCLGIHPLLQAHLVLEETDPFALRGDALSLEHRIRCSPRRR